VTEVATPAYGKDVLFVDEGDLWHLEDPESPEAARLVTSDACEPEVLPGGGFFGFVEPCSSEASARMVYDPDPDADAMSLYSIGPSNISEIEVWSWPEPEPVLFYLSDVERLGGQTVGTLWAGTLGEEPSRVAERASLESVADGYQSSFQAIVDFDGAAGTLIEWDPGGLPRELASRVALARLHDYILVNYDGNTGDRARIAVDGSVEVLASEALPGMIASLNVAVFVTEAEGNVGTLTMEDWDRELRRVAEGVPDREFDVVWWSSEVLAYLRDFDTASSTGTLEVYFPRTRDRFGVERVSDWFALGWPNEGIVYTVPDGDRAGTWFAEAF
jgi:hypothetical protein